MDEFVSIFEYNFKSIFDKTVHNRLNLQLVLETTHVWNTIVCIIKLNISIFE